MRYETMIHLKAFAHNITSDSSIILADIMQFRRMLDSNVCDGSSCKACFAPHLPKITYAMHNNEPIVCVLPAFPGKSPNSEKVFGPLPDMAEKLAIQFLSSLCHRIKQFYAPGAHIIICSDGRVFGDVVGMRDEDITAYQSKLNQIITEIDPTHISTFNLDTCYESKDFTQIRRQLMNQYAEQSLESLKAKVRRGGSGSQNPEDCDAHRMHCGMTKFLFEDALHPNQTQSRTSIQKNARVHAYEMVLRSNAWSVLIAERFPHAVRLSIHPQTCGATKLGIQLIGTETWLTPWHGVAVDTPQGFILMKRWEAEKHAFKLIRDAEGRPSHYKQEG